MTQLTHLSREAYEAWLVRLRTACLVVADNPPSLITSMTVSKHFDGLSDDDRAVLLALAHRLAEEYSLALAHSEFANSITVCVSRRTLRARDDDAPEAEVGESRHAEVSS